MMGNTTKKDVNNQWVVRVRDWDISIEVYDHEAGHGVKIPIKSSNMAIGLGNALTSVGLEMKNGYEL